MLAILKKLFTKKTEKMKEIIFKAFLVDVRTDEEFASGNVKGSVNIPLDQIQNQLSKFKDKQHIIVFCRSGNRSSQAKTILEQNGFMNVLNGGTWQEVNTILNN